VTRRRFHLLTVAFAALAVSTLGAPARADAPAATKVSMKDFAFMPATITIKAGTAVTWTYDESPTDPMGCEGPEFQAGIPNATCPGHSTTSVDTGAGGKALWDSGVHRASGFPFSYTFTKPGTYRYYCTVHGGPHPNNPITHMDGTIVVAAASAAEAISANPQGSAAAAPSSASAASGQAHQLPQTGGTLSAAWALGCILFGAALLRLRRALG